MDTKKVDLPDDPDKTIRLPDADDGKTIVLSADALKQSSSGAPSSEKEENFSYTWFHGTRDVNALISAENQKKSGLESPISISPPETPEPELIAKDQLYLKKRDFNGGGQGILSEQIDLSLGRTVAVKSLRKELLEKTQSRESFIREAQISARLEHPSIIPIYSLTGDEEKGLHLAMKLIKGMSLSDYLKQISSYYRKDGIKNYNEEKTLLYRLDLFLRICDALAYAHSRNIMHRDLKPENIIIGNYREIYVMDWGIAQHIVKEKDEQPDHSGQLWGTPVFMSPELLAGRGCDQRADIYALGMILFEMVYLKPGITGKSLQEILGRAKNSQFESFRHRFGFPVSSELTAIIRKAVNPDLNIRYQTVEEFSQDLRRFIAGEETQAKPDHWVGKILRSMSRHRKIAAALILLLLLGFITELAYSFYKQRNEEIFRRRYDRALTRITATADTAAYEIEQQILSLGVFLQLFCEEMTVRLNNPPEPSTERPEPFKQKEKTPAPGSIYSPLYKVLLKFNHFGMFIAKENADIPAAQKQIEQLAPMLKKTEARFLNCSLPDLDVSATTEEKKREFALHGGAMVWFYLGMENGLYLQYPASDALPQNYDPRKRPWYQTGITNFSERLIWSKPYWDAQVNCLVMTGTRSYLKKDKAAGVVGFDVALEYFSKIIDRYGTDSRFTRGKYILDQDGTILVAADRDSDSVWGGNRRIAEKVNADSMLNVKNLDFNRIFEKIQIRKSGIIKQEHQGETLLYVFFPIRIRNWTYVEIVSIADYLADTSVMSIGN